MSSWVTNSRPYFFQYMVAALRDCVPQMYAARHLESTQQLMEAFDKEITKNFNEVSEICFMFP